MRTVRRDIDRLRDLGYPVEAARGVAGYRLSAGAAMPPLLLDDDEAVAVAVSLRAATSVAGIEETALAALAKLDQVLPSRLRYRVRTIGAATARAEPYGPVVRAEVLLAVADAVVRKERLRFDYTRADAEATRRQVEPAGLVSMGARWYLVGFDLDRDDWRTFRADRVTPRLPNGPRFVPRPLPAPDLVSFLRDSYARRDHPHTARVRLAMPLAEAIERVWERLGTLEADGTTTVLTLGADTVADLVWMITSAGVDFAVIDGSAELDEALRAYAARLWAGARG